MPRSSFSENPLLRVSRPVSACSRCRAAKVKCDGKLPACTACEKAGRENECSSANDQFARGKERSYVAALELRIEKLERRLAYARSRKASVNLHGPDVAPAAEFDRKDSLAHIRAAIHRKAARKRENSDVNSLVSDFGFLSVNATTRDFEPSVSSMTFARLVLAATTNEPLGPPSKPGIPPRQVTQSIIHYYMNNVYALFPSFPETALWKVLDDIYHQDHRMIKDADYWLLFLVLAIGSMAQSRSRDDAFYLDGVNFVSLAMAHADRALMPGYVAQIQSLLLLTQYAMMDPTHFDSWHLIGFTCRATLDLGFHQDPPPTQINDKNALDMRRKLFYSVYSIDRAISMVHARAFSFVDESIDVSFPSSTGIGRIPSISGTITGPRSADPALLLFQLRRIQSHWYQTLFHSDPTPLPDSKSFVWQMCLEMREWAESLPDSLPKAIRQLFELELRYSYVYCISPCSRAPQISDYGRMLIFEHVMAYVGIMYGAAHGTQSCAFLTYHDTLRVYFMASQLIAILRDAEDVLLSGRPIPIPISRPELPPPPPLPPRQDQQVREEGSNLDRSLRCIGQIQSILGKFGERWDDATTWNSTFEMISAERLDRLKRLKQMQLPIVDEFHRQPNHHPQHRMHANHSPAPIGTASHQAGPPTQAEVNWTRPDVGQTMMGGGGGGGGGGIL